MINKLESQLLKLNDNINYWTLYNKYKEQMSNLFIFFFEKKRSGFSFDDSFKIFHSLKAPILEPEIDAFNQIKKLLYFK